MMRRWIQIVTESAAVNAVAEAVFYRGAFRTKYGPPSDDEIVVLKNPSRGEFQRFHARSEHREVRGLLQDDLLVWDAFKATHSDIASFFQTDGSDLHLGLDEITVNDCPDDWTDQEADTAAHWIKTHPAIVMIYGADVRLTLESPDSGNVWTF